MHWALKSLTHPKPLIVFPTQVALLSYIPDEFVVIMNKHLLLL
jgi:hypothetical protein